MDTIRLSDHEASRGIIENQPGAEQHVVPSNDECLLPVGGIQALTTIDFPGKLAAVFFTMGCPWNCRYCHNHALKSHDDSSLVSYTTQESFLSDRQGFLDGIVVSGGEPTCHKRLPEYLTWIRDFGYTVAIHTNGYYPDMLRRIISKGLVDYVAMDIKAPPRAYDRVTGAENTCITTSRSIEIILSSKVEYEFRTTYHPSVLSEDELRETVRVMSSVGAKRYYLQRFRNQGVADEELAGSCEVSTIPEDIITEASSLFDEFAVR